MVEETVSKIRVKSKILKKPKIGNEGISENLGGYFGRLFEDFDPGNKGISKFLKKSVSI